MISQPFLNVRPLHIPALLFAMLLALASGNAFAQGKPAPREHCWNRPAPETIAEMFKASGERETLRRQAQLDQRPPTNAVLLISNGGLKVAYSAGLLVGWAAAGERPRFSAITAVGVSALIAPFAFIGQDGDQAIADIFNCEARGLQDLAERAALSLDESVLAGIAREHIAGRRLFVGLPGSAARPEAVWDFGALASSGQSGALTLARDILRAAVVVHTSVVAGQGLAAFSQTFPQSDAFRSGGAGREFVLPPQLTPVVGAQTRYFFIHNDRLFWDDSAEYIQLREGRSGTEAPAPALLPAYDIIRQVVAAKSVFRFASPKSAGGLVPSGEFDLTYLRALFHHAYRHSRMGEEWTGDFPGLKLGTPRP